METVNSIVMLRISNLDFQETVAAIILLIAWLATFVYVFLIAIPMIGVAFGNRTLTDVFRSVIKMAKKHSDSF